MKVLAMLILVLVCFVNSNASFAETAYEKYQRVNSEWYDNLTKTYISKQNLGCKNIVEISNTLMGTVGLQLAADDDDKFKSLMKSMPGHKLEKIISTNLDLLFRIEMVSCQKN